MLVGLLGVNAERAHHFDRLVELGLLVATQSGDGFGGGVGLGLEGFVDLTVGLGSFADFGISESLHRDTHGTSRAGNGAGRGVHFERVHVSELLASDVAAVVKADGAHDFGTNLGSAFLDLGFFHDQSRSGRVS